MGPSLARDGQARAHDLAARVTNDAVEIQDEHVVRSALGDATTSPTRRYPQIRAVFPYRTAPLVRGGAKTNDGHVDNLLPWKNSGHFFTRLIPLILASRGTLAPEYVSSRYGRGYRAYYVPHRGNRVCVHPATCN